MRAKGLCLLLCVFTMASCTTLASMIVEDTLQDIVVGPNKAPNTSNVNSKALEKERKQMIKEGKCPVCRGVGKSIDGKYECSICNGTGKYIEQNNTQP